jgi:hypothetical protein
MREFIELIERYKSITFDEIDEIVCKYADRLYFKQELTGFGNKSACSLCKAYLRKSDIYSCNPCPWVFMTGYKCNLHANRDTFKAIDFANNIPDLLKAYRERAEYMEEVLRKYNEKTTI